MPREWMLICVQLAMLFSGAFGNAFVARNTYGMISVVGPALVNREVTLKVTQFYPWECDVEWKYIMDKGTKVQTMNGTLVKRYSENGLFFLKWTASDEYNRAQFYADCSANTTIRTQMTSLNMKDIIGQCGALVLLSPVVLGADVKLGYFPADHYIHHNQSYNTRTWKKHMDEKQLRESSYVEEKVSEYLYILTIFRFNESNEGTYVLNCKLAGNTNYVQLHISGRPSYPVLGPKSSDFITTEYIYVYGGSDVHCKTENGTEPVQVILLIGQDLFVLSESEGNKGSYRLDNVHQQMAGLTRRNVTCQVSNSALETPYEVHGTLCNVDPPSDISISVNKMEECSNKVTVCFLNMSCETDASNLPCTIELSSDIDNLRYVHSNNWTNGESGNIRSISHVLFNVTKDMLHAITCSTRCDHFPLHLNASYEISFSGSHLHDKVNQTFSSTSRFPFNKVLIGTGVFFGLCILFIIGIGRCVLVKRRKVNEINTIEIVENHSDTSSDNGVLHIAMEGVEYAVVQRQAATHGIETQQPHDVDGLAYAELDINFLQEANARVSSRRKNTPTEYAYFELSSSQAPDKDYACQNASYEC